MRVCRSDEALALPQRISELSVGARQAFRVSGAMSSSWLVRLSSFRSRMKFPMATPMCAVTPLAMAQ